MTIKTFIPIAIRLILQYQVVIVYFVRGSVMYVKLIETIRRYYGHLVVNTWELH